MQPFTLIDIDRRTEVAASVDDEGVRLDPDGVRDALGWELRPEGLCRDSACVPVAKPEKLVNERGIELNELAAALGRPLALDRAERAAALGAASNERAAQLATLEAPDFTLPDLEGNAHTLSEHRGKKVLLIAYASW